jgi:hypothetical protein
MHILILAPSASAAEKVGTALSSNVHRCSVAKTWTDVLTSLESDRPDLALIEGGSWGQTETKSVGAALAANSSAKNAAQPLWLGCTLFQCRLVTTSSGSWALRAFSFPVVLPASWPSRHLLFRLMSHAVRHSGPYVNDIILQYCPDVSNNMVRLWCAFGELTARVGNPSVCVHTWDGEAA